MIEEASTHDAEEILAVMNISNREAYREVIPKEHFKDPILFLDEVLENFERMTWCVYRVKGRVVGTGGLSIQSDDTGRIHLVYVLPEYQRRGIGTAVVTYLEERAREMGLKRARLLTVKKAQWAVTFYKKLGYTLREEVERTWGPDVWMAKELGASTSDR